MSHYYINDEKLKNNESFYDVQILGASFRFYTNDGVFSKKELDFGSQLLIKNMLNLPPKATVIDMGTGYGPIGIIYAKHFKASRVYMYDVNLRAIELAKKNIAYHNVQNAKAFESFLFEKVDVKADLILTNPPIRAGKDIVFKLYEQAHLHLNDDGILLVVIQKKQGAQSSFKKLSSLFKVVETIDKKGGYWIIYAKK